MPKEEKGFAWFTSVKQIAENDFILSANTYNPYSIESKKPHRPPQEILQESQQQNAKLKSTVKEIETKLKSSH